MSGWGEAARGVEDTEPQRGVSERNRAVGPALGAEIAAPYDLPDTGIDWILSGVPLGIGREA